ncbi:hypothetical protein [Enterococcus sp. DIV2469a]|uniref:Rgg family transcriptional regulator n=1 Tax=unclassified Enterococcus TaxID=2608891 RepID=UPI003F689734
MFLSFRLCNRTIKNILPRAIDRLGSYRNFNHYTDEVYRLLSNVIIYFMQNNDFNSVFHYIQVMEKIELNEEQIFERLLSKFFEGIKLLLLNNKEAQQHIDKCLQVMEFLELKHLKNMSKSVIDQLS